jgi:hypothetical protein
LQGRRSYLHGVGKDICSVLDLCRFVLKRLSLILDLGEGVSRLSGIENYTGTKLRASGR